MEDSIKMINCEQCGVRINSNHAIEEKGELKHYCRKCYDELFTQELSCMYCEHFKFARGKYHYLKNSFTITRTKEKGLWGECELHNKTVTTHSKTCNDYKYAYKNGETYCTKEHIIKDCAVNDNCHRAKHNCDECFTKEFWEEVISEKDSHVIGMEWSDGQVGVDYYTTGDGGYYDRRFSIEFEDGEILNNVGLWSRGRCPNKKVYNAIRHGKIISVDY